jgi:crotonobetaine/carnitine-CoA ligase
VTTFHELLRSGADAFADRPALMVGASTLTYAQLLMETERVAAGFQALGLGPDDRLALIMDNSLECVLAWLASSVLGCTDIPINPQYRGQLLRYLLADSAAAAVVCDSAYLAQLAEIAGDLPALKQVVVNGDGAIAFPGTERVVSFAQCAASAPALRDPGMSAEHVVLYSSGTTGPSKGVVHSQASCLTLARYNAEVMEYGPSDRLLNFFPLFHQNARYTGVIPALVAGAAIRLERKLSTSAFWSNCRADGITAFNYLGSVLRLILNVTPPGFRPADHTLRKAFGAGATPDLMSTFEEKLGIAMTEVYGLTEAPMATVNHSRRSPAGSAGRAGRLFEVAVVDDGDRILPPDSVGEIVLRPKVPDALMVGYLNKDAATVAAFRNLWFHSGDRGRLSAAGDLYFEERQKDSIRRRGENVSAWEVESVLDQHPDVAESAVFGIGVDDGEEEVAAALVLTRPSTDLAAIVDFARRHLPDYAVPTLLRVVEDLPRTPTAKVQKSLLRSAKREGFVRMAANASGKPVR